MMRYFVSLSLLVIAFAFSLGGCDEGFIPTLDDPVDDPVDDPDDDPDEVMVVPVEVRTDVDSQPVRLDIGETHHAAVPDRQALLVVHKGLLSMDGERDVEIDQVFDAEVYAGPDDEVGDPHWITRARVLDEGGEPLWTRRVNSLYQLLEFLGVIIDDQIPISVSVEAVHRLAKEEYPELIRFAIKVPTRLEGAETYVLEIADDDGNFSELASFPISELEELAEAPAPDFEYEIETLVDAGSPHDHLNVAILGDGYTEAERHLFEGDAQAVADRLLSTSPISEHADIFNIKTVWTPGAESGAGYDCNYAGAPSDCEHRFRDNVYDTTFVIPALGDLFGLDVSSFSDRVAMPLDLSRIYEVASLAHYDEIILVVNSPKRSGFAGLYVAVVTNFDDRASFPDVAVHEVGHTLGLLGDEYNIGIDTCYYNEPTIPLPANISDFNDDTVRWSEWVEEQTPLPTPSTDEYSDTVGAFEGAYNCDFLVRPERNCMMRSSGHDFCAVCAEHMVRRFYAMVDPAPLVPSTVFLGDSGEVELTVPTRDDGDRYEVIWTADDTPLDTNDATLQLDAEELPADGWLNVEAIVRNQSGFLHSSDDAVTSQFQFQLRRETER